MKSRYKLKKPFFIIALSLILLFVSIYGLFSIINGLNTKPIYGQEPSPSQGNPQTPSPSAPNTDPYPDYEVNLKFTDNSIRINNIGEDYDYSVFTRPDKLIIQIRGRNLSTNSDISSNSGYFENITVRNDDNITITADIGKPFKVSREKFGNDVVFNVAQMENESVLIYRNSTTRNFFTLKDIFITSKSDSDVKYYTESYSNNGLTYTMKFEKNRVRNLKDELLVYNDTLLNYVEITSDNNYRYITFNTNKKLIFYPNTRDYDSTLTLIDPNNNKNYIVIDPGHGGLDPGAVYEGRAEKEVTFDLALILQAELEKRGYNVYMIAEEDWFSGLHERIDIANLLNAEIFISIHVNSFDDTSVHGILMQYKNNKELATFVQNGMLAATGSKNMGIGYRNDLLVLNKAKMPAILIETGFLTNTDDWNRLRDRDYLIKMANGIANGVSDFFKK